MAEILVVATCVISWAITGYIDLSVSMATSGGSQVTSRALRRYRLNLKSWRHKVHWAVL